MVGHGRRRDYCKTGFICSCLIRNPEVRPESGSARRSQKANTDKLLALEKERESTKARAKVKQGGTKGQEGNPQLEEPSAPISRRKSRESQSNAHKYWDFGSTLPEPRYNDTTRARYNNNTTTHPRRDTNRATVLF